MMIEHSTNDKPFSTACERNKAPILEYLRQWLTPGDSVLEIGSGTGQHGVFFASQLPHIVWQCTEQAASLAGLQQWIDEAQLKNLPAPFPLDVNHYTWGTLRYRAVFSANILHIMSWPTVKQFLGQVNKALFPAGKLILYGPFRHHNVYTSDSNAEFDQYLKVRDAQSGIRDLEAIQAILKSKHFAFIKDQPMPVNNQLLLWQLSSENFRKYGKEE